MKKTSEEVKDVKLKTKSGLISLFSRSFFIYGLRALSILLLARFLDPKDYGLFGILNSWVWAINLFLPDLSMFTALIQQKLAPDRGQMRNLFGVSLYRSLFIVILFVVMGKLIVDYHLLDSSAYWMLVALSSSMFFEGIKAPFRMTIERNLNFKAIVYIEVIETFLMYLTQIIAAWMGAGTWSFIIAIVTRALSGLILYYFACERKIYLPIISIKEIKKLFHYEIMVQLKKILIGVKGLVVPVVLGRILGDSALGIVMWSLGIASIPVVLAHNYDRVLFPALSKLQGNTVDFKAVASKGVEYSTLGLGLLFGLIAACSSAGVEVFFPDKWESAIELLPLCAFALFLAQIRYMGASIMNASGHPKKLLFLEGAAVLLELSFAIPATIYAQATGYLYALIGVELIMCLVTFKVNMSYMNWKSLHRVAGIVCAFILSFYIINFYMSSSGINAFWELGVTAISYPLLFLGVVVLIDHSIVSDVKNYLKNLTLSRKKV